MIKIIKQRLASRHLYPIGLFLFAASICMTAGTAPFNSTYTDSTVFIYIGKIMQNGQVPYLDAFDHKGLLQYVINYIGLCVGGKTGIWVYEIISLFISLIICFKTVLIITNSRMLSFFSILCAFALLGSYFEGGNLTEEYALPFISISLYIFTKHFFTKENSIKTFNIIVLGFSFAAVIMLRPNMIAVWIVYCTAAIIKLLKEKQYSIFVKYVICFLIGTFVVFIPCIIYFIANSAFFAFIAQYFEFNFKYSSSAGARKVLYSIIYFSSTTVFALSMIVYALLVANIRKYNSFIVFSGIAYLLLTIILVTISGMNFGHYGMVLIPCYIIPMGYFLEFVRTKFLVKYNTCSKLIVLLVIVCVITKPQLLDFGHFFTASVIRVIKNKPSAKSKLIQFIEANTTANDKIIVFGNRVTIYLESNRYSASKYFYQYPVGSIDKRIATEFIKDIKLKNPKIIADPQNFITDKTDTMASFLKTHTASKYDKYSIGGSDVFLLR